MESSEAADVFHSTLWNASYSERIEYLERKHESALFDKNLQKLYA